MHYNYSNSLMAAAKRDEPIHILVIGKTRVGKSAVINAIAGAKIAGEGQTTKDITRDVIRHGFTVGDVKYVAWEAPGLQDTSEDDCVVIRKLQKVLQRENIRINLVIYCTLMNRERFEQSEENAISHITEAFSPNFWRKAVFALTYANRVLPPAGYESDEEEAEWFQSRILQFKNVIEGALIKSGVSSDKASEIEVIPAGYHTVSRRMPDAREFYCRGDWIPQFSQTCAKKMNKTSSFHSRNPHSRSETVAKRNAPQQELLLHQEVKLKSDDQPVNILVIGKTRVGKSAVINAIAGAKIAREGQTTKDISREVIRHDFTIGNVKYVTWEAPGLQDISEDDSVVINKLKNVLNREHSYINLVIYCTLMNRERFEQSEEDAIRHITEAFNADIWENAVFALTQANRVLPPSECETDEMEAQWFESRIDDFKNVITSALVKSGVSSEKASNVAVVPAGYHTVTRRVPNAKEFYGISDWVPQFWKHCQEKSQSKGKHHEGVKEELKNGSEGLNSVPTGQKQSKTPVKPPRARHIEAGIIKQNDQPAVMIIPDTNEETSSKPPEADDNEVGIHQQNDILVPPPPKIEQDSPKKCCSHRKCCCCCTIL